VLLARLVLEGVRIDGIEAQPAAVRFFLQGSIVLDEVPGEMGRYARRDPAELLDDRAILEFLMDVGRCAGKRKLRESSPAAARAPGGQGDREGGNALGDRLDLEAAASQLAAQGEIIILQRLAPGLIGVADEIR